KRWSRQRYDQASAAAQRWSLCRHERSPVQSHMDYDLTDIPAAYDRGRDHGPEFLDLWMHALDPHFKALSVASILDLGCGTGRFSEALSAHFTDVVVGFDPTG